jgi:hypothetical protein
MKKYIIADYNSHVDAWQYVSEIGQTPKDTFYSIVSYEAENPATPPVEFNSRAEAKRVLDPLRVQEDEFWRQTRAYGRRQPKWKIYPAT